MIVLKKKQILCVLSVVIFGVLSAVILAGFSQSASSQKGLVLVIDAGHGGIDGGVVGKNTKVKESDLNLQIAKKLEKLATGSSFSTVMTRKTADGLYGMATSGFKSRDMQKRKEIINSSSADYVISIHQNRFHDEKRRGAQVFYSKNGNENTVKFAESMQNYLNKQLNIPTVDRAYSAQEGDFFIVKCSNIPTIIVECGFLSNAEDERLLSTESYQNKLANILLSGLLQFVSELNEGGITPSLP